MRRVNILTYEIAVELAISANRPIGVSAWGHPWQSRSTYTTISPLPTHKLCARLRLMSNAGSLLPHVEARAVLASFKVLRTCCCHMILQVCSCSRVLKFSNIYLRVQCGVVRSCLTLLSTHPAHIAAGSSVLVDETQSIRASYFHQDSLPARRATT